MIVRILGEGQYGSPTRTSGTRSRRWTRKVADAVDSGDETPFAPALAALTAEVRRLGEPVADDTFAPSDLVSPSRMPPWPRPRGCSPTRRTAPRADER